MAIVPLPLPGMAQPPRAGQRLGWPSHLQYLDQHWEPGQHVGILSPTGRGGKSWLITRGLLPLWRDSKVLYIDIKDYDSTLEGFGTRVERFPNFAQVRWAKRKWFRLHLPSPLAGGASLQEQAQVVQEAMARAYRQQGWVIVADEMKFLTKDLGLSASLRDIWTRGRSMVTLITATQSPRWVPGEAYDQPTYLYLGRLNAEGNKRLGEIGGTIDYHLVRRVLGGVRKHEFLFLDKSAEDPEQTMAIVKVGR